MLRYLISFIFVLLALRFVASLARMLSSGGSRPSVGPETQPDPKSPPQFDTSTAIDVPFTEIPPESPR